jgi:outer membrane protein
MKVFQILLLAVVFAVPAYGHEKGDWILRTGVIVVDPDESSDVIDVAGLVTLPGVDIDDDTQLGITGAYMLTDKWGLELLAATPFTHDIEISDLGIQAGETKQLPPTLMLQYYLGSPANRFTPYIGLGVNYTIFFDEEVDDELNLALDGIVGLPPGTVDADLSLKESWGYAAQIGFDYMLNEKWMINGVVWYMDIDTEARIRTAAGNVKFDVDVDPLVYMFSVGYRF